MAPQRGRKGVGLNRNTAAMMGAGLELGLLIGGLTYAGYWFDQRWGTDPWGLLTGALVGTIGGCFTAYRVVKPPRRPKEPTGRPPAGDGPRDD